MKNNKIMSTLVVLTLVLSGMMVMNTYDVGIVDTAKATRLIEHSGGVILSNDGTVNQSSNLTCGEELTWHFNSGNFTEDDDYIVKVWNGTHYRPLVVDNEVVDSYGDLAITFHVPGWDELAKNPIANNATGAAGANSLSNGSWNISLFEDASTDVRLNWTNTTIHIGNLYDVSFEYGGEEIDHLIYGATYSGLEVHVKNWTGSNWDDDFSTSDLDANLFKQDGSEELNNPLTDFDNVGSFEPFQITPSDVSSTNKEVYYWVNVTYDLNDVNDDFGSGLYSNVSLPVLLNMSFDVSSDITWGETIEINNGWVLNGTNDGLDNYGIRVYAPCEGGYTYAKSGSTAFDGSFSYDINTGSEYAYSAGTWYVGTYSSDDSSPRVNMTDEPPYMPGFIPYGSFVVHTREDVSVDVENTDDIIVGFNQTINVSVQNESWMENYEFKNMMIHVTGLEAWNQSLASNGVEFTDDDIVPVDATMTKDDDDYAYYEFTYFFNQTGTGTILVSWPGNQTSYAYNDSSYGDTYGNESTTLLANCTGTTTFDVLGAEDMNLIVTNMVESVQTTSAGTGYQNDSQNVDLEIYGDTQSEGMNATIEITGCGLDITIDEEDPGDTSECLNWPGKSGSSYTAGQYQVKLSPKTSGTITITVTNDTEDKSLSKDYAVKGLSGTVTTSDGDDLKITVGETETITADVAGGQYAKVYVTYLDENWANPDRLNYTVGDGSTEGEGLNGIFNFVPDEDELEQLGYIVVAANAGDLWMYDIVEIEPINDLEIELVEPTLANATPVLTVGLEQDLIFKIVDSDGNVVDEDDPQVTVKLIDEDHDEDNPLMEWSSTTSETDWIIDESGDEWELEDMRPWFKGQLVITGKNATDGIAHQGNLTLEVDYATITYSPESVTAGIGEENFTVTVTGVDANGDPLPDGTTLYLHCTDSVDTDAGGWGGSDDYSVVDFKDADTEIELDEDGVGEFELDVVGDNKTSINATLYDDDVSDGFRNTSIGNRTLGKFNIYYPNFALDPDTVYIGQSNDVMITATDTNGDPIYGINLTFVSSVPGILSAQPDPVMTNADGIVELSVSPQASGKLNVTMARDLEYEDGQLNWTNAVVTDTYVTVTSIKAMKISVSKSPIYQGETLTVTVTAANNALSGVDVTFAEETVQTDSNGEATFTGPDPGIESAIYTITAEKAGYTTAEKSITVIKVYTIQLVGPSTAPAPGEDFTVSVIVNGNALAGATVEFNGETYTSNARGEITLTAPDSAGSYTVSASYGNYEDGTVTINVEEGEADGVPGFELFTLVAALGVAFILLRRRRQ